MSGLFQVLVVAVLVLETLAVGQGSEVARVLAEVREALGGDAKISGVRSVLVDGTRARISPDGQRQPGGFQLVMELPARFARREVMGNFNGVELTRTTGFDGADPIDRADGPPQAGGGGRMMIQMRSGGAMGGASTPEQVAAQKAAQLRAARRDFARVVLGMFGAGPEVFPLEFAYAGTAESPDATADVLTVTGPDGFQAKLFVNTASHLPLMLTWMDKEPIMVTAGGPGGVQVIRRDGGAAPTEQDIAKMREEMAQRMREAEANRRVVEYRLFYADYKPFGDLTLPTRLVRMIDGEAVEELTFDTVTINGPIDAKFFEKSGR